ncbi:MAG TPA: class I SAM-dependent methyltransferase, partial [Actinomycetota bacterium]
MDRPRLYSDLAPWFHLLTAPQDYAVEADFYTRVLTESSEIPVASVLELGSGGGNNASHMKDRFELTLTDLSEEMLAVSRSVNPEIEHVAGDMRTLRLGRAFDGVFVHDAIDYMTTVEDLGAAIETAFVHCAPGGAALFAPDHVAETFAAATEDGGHDCADGRGLRYLEWTWDPDPSDDTYRADFAYLLRKATGEVEIVHDCHTCGLFPRARWLELIETAGFRAELRDG